MNAVAVHDPGRIAAPLRVGTALRKAVRGFYEHSIRLVILNALLSGLALAILTLSLYQPAALILLLVLGPLAAALMHCAVTIVQDDDLRFADALTGIRLHWRRGFVLGALVAAGFVLTLVAVAFYAGRGAPAWPLAVLTLYVSGLFGLYQLALWPLAIAGRDHSLRSVLRAAAFALLGRPLAFIGLGAALVLINLIGLVAAVLPFLTMTSSYSFLAAAYFTLPPPSVEEE
jgi:hypothetical protein